MKLFAVGAEPVGVIAIGANATGIVAVGQLATGVLAIGQLARGGIVIGQLGLGLVAIGQLAIGVLWAGGMAGIAATSGPGLVVGPWGRLFLLRLLRRQEGPAFVPARPTRTRVIVAAVVAVLVVALWWLAAGRWLVDDLTRTGGILVEAPPPLPCEPLC